MEWQKGKMGVPVMEVNAKDGQEAMGQGSNTKGKSTARDRDRGKRQACRHTLGRLRT